MAGSLFTGHNPKYCQNYVSVHGTAVMNELINVDSSQKVIKIELLIVVIITYITIFK